MSGVASILLFAFTAVSGQNLNVSNVRRLSSPGCQNCCFNSDCRLAYKMTSAGVCCGSHRRTGTTSCCPMGASCVQCNNVWRCTNDRYITSRDRCSICASDPPPECLYSRRTTYSSGGGGSMIQIFLFLLIGFAVCGACYFFSPKQTYVEEPVVVTGQPYGQPGYGQPVYAQQGYGAGSVAMGAGAGFVGGMLVGEALDGHHGYGGGYGGEYGGGYGGGGDFGGGGDGGFDAD